MVDEQSADKTAIRFHNISKQFGGAKALADVSFAVRAGSIHGLVGQNGAGKSTLIKILAGLHRPDGGSIEIDGLVSADLSPHRIEKLGIHFIHQDRLLVPSFTVGEALFLGHEPRIAGTPFTNRRAMKRQADAILQDYFGLRLPTNALVSELTTAQKQIVQITRALLAKPKVLVFDEPTAALVRREADILFALIRRLRSEGVTIIYISHYLGEIEDLCDDITVLRNGQVVVSRALAGLSAKQIATLMVERDIAEMFPKAVVEKGERLLDIRNLTAAGRYHDVSLSLHRGEVLGITGLLGSGAKEFVQTLFGLETATSGDLRARNGPVSFSTPRQAVSRQLALVPEDRRGNGVALDLTVLENTTLASLDRFSKAGFVKAGFVKAGLEKTAVARLIAQLQIKAPSCDAPVRTLSGGNQQKVAIAKWLSRQSEIYLLDEPTVGVDIGAKVEIYQLIADLVQRGAGVIILSSDLPELVGITDRILVFFRGRITAELTSAQTTPDAIFAAATGSEERQRHVG
ncbi:sugar ABC transporter ATP-binding protein [Rhizobium sp.]|jgi:ribose transport system ATP-binding protein|uniref:sugar ABC transporter ATP-binding protein n=1 Tax=Rhizobium sp. TaxID=391 RepID=UPI000E9B0022|nr:sugar ABC transporter [Rhizobium sp.]